MAISSDTSAEKKKARENFHLLERHITVRGREGDNGNGEIKSNNFIVYCTCFGALNDHKFSCLGTLRVHE